MKTKKMAPTAAEQQQTCRFRNNCKILSGDNQLQFCDKHYKFHTDFLRNNPSILKKHQLDLLGSETPDLTKKKVKKQSSILPPDEERCCRIGGGRWRCKNFRMKTKNYCEQHCRYISQHNKDLCMKKKKSGAGSSKRVTETRDSNRRSGKRQPTDQPSTSNPTTSCAGSVKIGAKRKRGQRMSGDLESLTGIRGAMVETRASKRRKMVMEGGETSNQPVTNDNFDSDGIVEGGSGNIRRKRKNVERTKGSGEPVIEMESVELYKSNCFELSMELEKMKVEIEKTKVELEKKKVESTELQSKLEEVEETRMSTAEDEKATEYWRKRCSDLESLVQRMENENSTMTCVESRVSNLGSLVPGNGKESSIVRCQELTYQRDVNNMSEPTTSSDNRASKQREMGMEGDEISNQLATNDNFDSDRITEGGSPNIWTKMKNVESIKGSGEPVNDQLESVELYQSNCIDLSMEPEKTNVELGKAEVELEKNVESTKGSGEPVNDQLESMELYQSNCIELSMEPEKTNVELEKVKAELEKNEVKLEKNVERTKGSREPVNDQLESVELYESNCSELSMDFEKNKVEKNEIELEKNKMELEKMKAVLEKKKVECTEFQDKLVEVEETRKSICKDENATEFWSMKCSDAEILVQKVENENSTIGCVVTRVSNLVSLVPGDGKESSRLRCQEESEARGLQNEITKTCEKQRDQDMSKPNAETIGEASKDSRAYELKTEEKVLNVEEGEGWGCLEERPSQHETSSQADLEMCKKTSVNLVSDLNDGGDSLGAVDSLGDSVDMLAMKHLNMNKDKMTEADMLFSVEDCMKAVGALYGQEISKD